MDLTNERNETTTPQPDESNAAEHEATDQSAECKADTACEAPVEGCESGKQESPSDDQPAGGEPDADQPDDTSSDDQLETLKSALAQCEKQRDEYLLMAQRATADYQNFKRRNNTVRADAHDEGVRETIAAMLPVADNLDRAIEAARSDSGSEGLLSGVEMTRRQLIDILTKMGLEEIPALGEHFDPNLHNAVMRTHDENAEPGQILEVYQKGYRIKDRIIRYAMVRIASED